LEREGSAVFDIKWIRDNPEAFDAGLEAGAASAPWRRCAVRRELLALDETRREDGDAACRRRRRGATRRQRRSARAKGAKDEAKAAALMAEVRRSRTRWPGRGRAAAADKALQMRCR
jgi:seryl-tRNA synthetase